MDCKIHGYRLAGSPLHWCPECQAGVFFHSPRDRNQAWTRSGSAHCICSSSSSWRYYHIADDTDTSTPSASSRRQTGSWTHRFDFFASPPLMPVEFHSAGLNRPRTAPLPAPNQTTTTTWPFFPPWPLVVQHITHSHTHTHSQQPLLPRGHVCKPDKSVEHSKARRL